MKCVLTYYKPQQILLKVLENAKKYYIIIELVKLFLNVNLINFVPIELLSAKIIL